MPRPKSPNKKANGTEQAVSSTKAPEPRTGGKATTTTAPAASSEVRNTEMKPAAPRKNRKPEIVRAESRSNLIPINVEEEIRRLAYLMSERRGFTPGHETEDWLTAEREVLQRYPQHTA